MTTDIDHMEGRELWKGTILAGLANYIDAGSIVSGSAALALWAEEFNLSPTFIGVLGAIGANAISAGVGALVGGRLCDVFGRKRIYQVDMLFYAFGMLWLVFANQPWMIVTGFVIVGLSVGADIPASWSLIAEMAPAKSRAKHGGVAQMLWYLGPVVVLMMFYVLSPLGIVAARIVFAHLAVIAIILTIMRSGIRESVIWERAQAGKCRDRATGNAGVGALFSGRYLRSMVFLISLYGTWNLWAGTNGFFFPYILRTVGSQSQATSVAMQAAGFLIAMISIVLVFMRYADRANQRRMIAVASAIQIAGMVLLAVFPLTSVVALAYLVLVWFGSGFGAQSFFQLWSAELFPTLLRSTAQGITFAVVRIGLGFWSLFVPLLTAAGFTRLAWILTGFLVVSGLIGYFGAPTSRGMPLDEIDSTESGV